jgi:hypothetical protein
MADETRRAQTDAPDRPGDLGWPSSSGPAAVGCQRQADVAQLVEHRHGKAGVKGSSPFVGSFLYRKLISSSVHLLSKVVLFCPSGEDGESPGANASVFSSSSASGSTRLTTPHSANVAAG